MASIKSQSPVPVDREPQVVQIIVDPVIRKCLGPNQTVVSIDPYGNSNWATTARVTTVCPRGRKECYFLKMIRGQSADQRVLGEFNGMSELFRTLPAIIPKPQGVGKCQDTDSYFFLSQYIQIDHRAPDPVRLGQKIADLHRASISPTGKFGFFSTPFDGKLPLHVDWDSSWSSFYTKLLKGVYELDIRSNGPWDKLDQAMQLILDHVIPRLLDPLESGGRQVKPCLIHGDLWEDNIGTHTGTGEIYLIDPAAFYAHHEMGVAMWRVRHHRMNAPIYRNEYFKHYPADEPVSECDDRNRLYSIKETIMYSALKPGSITRNEALKDMEFLIEKFAKHART